MRALRAFLLRLTALQGRGAEERELAEELDNHLQMETEANIRAGMTPDEARRAALVKSGGLEQAKEAWRDQRRPTILDGLRRDLAFALRQCHRNPGFAILVVLLSGIGIGGVAVMFSVLWGVLLRPLPYPDPDRLIWADAITDAGRRNSLSAMDYFDYLEQCTAFESLAARSIWQPGRVVTGKAEPERVSSSKVSGNFFHTLGIPPFLGRSFSEAEQIAGGPNVVVVSRRFWERKLDARSDVVGAPVTIDGEPHQVVGVMPATFDYPAGVELWFPMRRNGGEESGRGNNNFFIIGRLAPGAKLARAQEEMTLVAARISQDFPEAKGGWGVVVTPLHDQLFGSARPIMLTLIGATVLLLLILCANLASLLHARVLSRRAELAVRLSLGASASTLTRQLLIESFVMVAIGATLGVGLAHYGIRAVKAFGPGDIPRLAAISLDATVLLMAIAAAAFTALLSGVAPAIQGSRLDLVANLRGCGRATGGRGQVASRRWLVAVQLALSLVLLVIAGLLTRSMARLQQVDPGLRAEGLLTVDVQIPGAEAEGHTERYLGVIERIRALPGVVSVAGADQLPFFGGPWNGVHRLDQPPHSSSDLLPATRRVVTEGFFGTMGIPLVAGRDLQRSDHRDSPLVTVVSESLARQLFPGVSPVGRVLVLPGRSDTNLEIVGVAGDVHDFGLATDFRPAFYLSLNQVPWSPESLRLAIRSAGEAAALGPSVRKAVHEVENSAPLFRLGEMKRWVADSTATERFSSFVLASFAAIATLLATAGLFGLMSYIVAQRQREIGIRLALGAPAGSVLKLVLRQGFALSLAATAVGIPVAIAAAHLVGAQLYAISPTDVLTFLGASLALVSSALAATLAPAIRAARIDCVEALRRER